ncbi:hypothetical protein Tco_0414735, partial [Tanacetum coccineum]
MAPFPLHTREEIPIALDKTRNKMSEENVPAPTPLRSNEQILPFNAWLPIGKGNLLLDLYILAFTASANVPTIYIQQFWNTLLQDAKTGVYSFQLDEQWFTLNVDLLSKALEITPVDSANPFESPPAGEQCLTGKTSGNDKSRHPVLQMLWGIVTRSNVDYAELLWEEFVQAIKTFFTDKANLSLPTKKPKPHFVPKGEKDEVFGNPIPQELITEAIQNSEYYEKYLEMAARKPTAKEGGKKKTAYKANKPKQPAPAKQSNPVKEKSSKPTLSKKIHKGKVMKVHKGKRSDNLIDEE